jgi:thiol-disulfide isomerase/thioredoxin
MRTTLPTNQLVFCVLRLTTPRIFMSNWHARISALYTLALPLCLLLPLTVNSAQLETHRVHNPHFSLLDLDGNTHSISAYRGRVVLVNFWASWCPPCIYEMPELTQLKERLADKPFEILAINVGEKKYRVQKFTRVINFNLPVLLDTSSKIFDNWGVKTLPTSFLIDAEGHIRYRVQGNPGWDDKQTIELIEQLLTETAKQRNHQEAPL